MVFGLARFCINTFVAVHLDFGPLHPSPLGTGHNRAHPNLTLPKLALSTVPPDLAQSTMLPTFSSTLLSFPSPWPSTSTSHPRLTHLRPRPCVVAAYEEGCLYLVHARS